MNSYIPPYLVRQYFTVCRQCQDHLTDPERTFLWSARRHSATMSRKERTELQRIAFHQAYKRFEREGRILDEGVTT